MKLDPTVMRNMERQDFRVLEAVEKGMQQHSLVPVALIASMASLRHGGTSKIISSLLRDKLLSHDQSCGYDGYRLTNSGYDILALSSLKQRRFVCALGNRIGTGKESDVYLAATPTGQQVVLKFHRLGRTSFRNVKQKRDYFHMELTKRQLQHGSASMKHGNMPHSWLFLSRLSAMKEYAFMKALHQVHFPTPTPLAHNRHVVVMSLVRGMPLYQIPTSQLSSHQIQSIMEQSTSLAIRLAQHGLVHCDLNEFNLMVDVSGVQHCTTTTTSNNNNHGTGRSIAGGDNHTVTSSRQYRTTNSRLPSDLDSVADPYVRHSGLPVSHEGALSVPAHAAHHQQHQQESSGLSYYCDGTGERITEAPPQPKEYLDNGQAKPIVMLIDFPQMVSTRHANAQELFERDMNCLKRFFTNKLRNNNMDGDFDPNDWDTMIPTWDDVVKQNENTTTTSTTTSVDTDDGETVCLASKAQIRLDEELRASGYSQQDAKHGSELFYYESQAHCRSVVSRYTDHDDDEDDDDDDDDNGNDDGNDNDNVECEEQHHHECGEQTSDNYDDDGDDDSREEDDNNNAGYPTNNAVVIDLMDEDQVSIITHKVAETAAKTRIRQELDAQKKKERQRGAFRKKNSSKSYVKGKRILADSGC